MKFFLILCFIQASLIFPVSLKAQTAAAPPEQTAPSLLPGSEAGESEQTLNTAFDFYNAGKYSEAARLFLKNPGIGKKKIKSYYNSARSYHQDFLDNNSVESLAAAVAAYYRVLDIDPEHHETLFNLELARIELEKYEDASDQKKQNQENQESLDEGQEGSESGKEGSDQKQDNKDKSEQDNLNSLAQEQQNLADSEQNDNSLQKQSSLIKRTEEAKNQSEENSQTQEKLEKALEKQKDAIEQMEQGNEEEARQSQEEAASLLEQAARSSSEENERDSESLPQDIQSILNQEQARNQDKQDTEDMIRVEKNW